MTRHPFPFALTFFAVLALAGYTAARASAALPAGTPADSQASPTPPAGPSPTPGPRSFEYKQIYQDGSFTIREAFLGTDAIWKADFRIPEARIADTLPSLGLGRDMLCPAQPGSGNPCTQTIDLSLAKGGTDHYLFRLDDLKGGAGVLVKNGRLIWSGQTNGANSFAVVSSRQIGDEIVFDYLKSNWGSNDPRVWISDSILMTQGATVVLLPNSFAPYPVQGRLLYFRMKGHKVTLVFNGKEIGAPYDDVIDRLCCWRGPSIDIAANGEMIDFFAQKGSDWYHVQAGYLPAPK